MIWIGVFEAIPMITFYNSSDSGSIMEIFSSILDTTMVNRKDNNVKKNWGFTELC